MKRTILETFLGAAVIVVAAGFLTFALQVSEFGAVDGYNVNARFLKVGGLEVGSDVRISGVKIGTVTDLEFDPASFEAAVQFRISSSVRLPVDTQAVVTGEGLLGDKYLRLIPGSATDMIAPGSDISQTQDFRTLEDAMSEIIFPAVGRQ